MNQEIKRKLTSRKLWVSVASFVSLIILAFGASDEVASQVTAIIMAAATAMAYVIGEGLVDAAGASGGQQTHDEG